MSGYASPVGRLRALAGPRKRTLMQGSQTNPMHHAETNPMPVSRTTPMHDGNPHARTPKTHPMEGGL